MAPTASTRASPLSDWPKTGTGVDLDGLGGAGSPDRVEDGATRELPSGLPAGRRSALVAADDPEPIAQGPSAHVEANSTIRSPRVGSITRYIIYFK